MASQNERESKIYHDLFEGGHAIISLASVSALMKQGELLEGDNGIVEGSQLTESSGRYDAVYNSLAMGTDPETGMEKASVIQLTQEGKLQLAELSTVPLLRANLTPMLVLDENLEAIGYQKGDIVEDDTLPNMGKWRVISENTLLPEDSTIFGEISLLGGQESVIEHAKERLFEIYDEKIKDGRQDYEYNRLNESLESRGEDFYIDQQEKESVLDDIRSGWKLANEASKIGVSRTVEDNIRDTGIEFGNEFEQHASKLSQLVSGIGAKIKDFFNKEEVISTNDIMAKGVKDEELACIIHDEAELRHESRISLKKYGELAREKIRAIAEKGIYALAGIGRAISNQRIDHFERLQTREENHIKAAIERIKTRSEREGNVKTAEQRVKAFISNIGRGIGNVGIAIANTAKFVTSGNLAKAVTTGEIEFDPKPYHPMLEGKDVHVTRSAFNTAMYRREDNRLIDSALHLAQIKAKLFHERISAVPMAERAQTADMLLGHMADSIGKASLMDRKIEYTTIEGRPAHTVAHTLEFTENGLIIDDENMTEKKYKGIGQKMSPNAMMHLFVESEKEALIYQIAEAERVSPDIVQSLNNENARMSYNMSYQYENNENYTGAMSDVHKELFKADGLMKNGYTFADKLQEKADKDMEESIRRIHGEDDIEAEVALEY